MGQISTREAGELLKQGALIVDVRTATEFHDGHLPGAVNVPIDQIESQIGHYALNKEHVLLLHCQSGMRSALAKRKLTEMGYRKAYDLGSYTRAMRAAAQG